MCPFKCTVTQRTVHLPVSHDWTTEEFINIVHNNIGEYFDYTRPDIICGGGPLGERGPAFTPNELPMWGQVPNDLRFACFYIRPTENREVEEAAAILAGMAGESSSSTEPVPESTLCTICYTAPRSMLFMPCRHLSACTDCATHHSVHSCPICRTPIEQRISVIVS